jgi:arylsulfatase A-like enzyme
VRSLILTAGLACALLACDPGPAEEAGPSDPPVILIIIDTLRADHLGCYGYPLDTSPVLDALAARSTVFEANSSQCNATFPSITSIMTGLYPKTHLNYLAVSIPGQQRAVSDVPTLAERLGERGYTTLAAVSHPWWKEAPTDTAIGRGWDAFSPIPPEITGEGRRTWGGTASATTDRVLGLLEARDAGRPLFLWAHYFDPHTPYDPPEPLRNRFLHHHLEQAGLTEYEQALAPVPPGARWRWIEDNVPEPKREALRIASGKALYDGEITDCDAELGRLLDALDAEGLLDPAYVVVVADHGENMDEGREHLRFTHARMYDGVIRVPLLVKLPGQRAGERVEAITQSIDIAPGLLELMGLPADPRMEGRSLAPLIEDPASRLHPLVFSESSDNRERMVRTEELKLVVPGDGESAELYRWRLDPGELRRLEDEAPPAETARLTALLGAFRPRFALELTLLPDLEPYELELWFDQPSNPVLAVVPPGAVEPVDGGARGTLRVEREPVVVILHLERALVRGGLSLVRTGAAGDPDLSSRVFLGPEPAAGAPTSPLSLVDQGVDLRFSRDLELGALLLGGHPEDPPPGAVVLRLIEPGDAGVIDESRLDPEQIAELRALGYLR